MSRQERHDHWAKQVAQQQASGLSVAAWCREQAVNHATFVYWRKRLCETDNSLAPAARWLALDLDEPSHPASDHPLTLRVGRVALDVRPGFDPRLLCDVLTVLEARC
jgi:hypothetical protein